MGRVKELLTTNDWEEKIDLHIDNQIKENQLTKKVADGSLPIPGETLHKYILRTNWPNGKPKDD